MSKSHTLRALVNERLAAAAEDIFVLFERTIAEYEEELCRCKEENQRKQQLLDKDLRPRVRGKVQIPPTCPGPGLNQKTPQIKEEPEEQRVKQEEEQLPEPVPESSAVCVKTEESSLLQQRQTELKEETQGEDISSQPHFHSETEGLTEHSPHTDSDDDWERPTSFSAAQMEPEADGDHYNQVQIRDTSTKPETIVHSGNMSGADGAEGKNQQCPFCKKRFGTIQSLQMHVRVHTGERPFSCLICDKSFTLKRNLHSHMRTHTGEKPYSCSTCDKSFAHKCALDSHVRTHTGERPYSCSICKKTFTQKGSLHLHTRIHTGEKPYSCSMCVKTFSLKSALDLHVRTHTGDKPYGCPVCTKHFADRSALRRHRQIHTRERPYSWSQE